MFQKMVQVEKQARDELQEKFENDLKEMKQAWNEQQLIALEEQRVNLEAKFSANLSVPYYTIFNF
jgi:hypothetical protein